MVSKRSSNAELIISFSNLHYFLQVTSFDVRHLSGPIQILRNAFFSQKVDTHPPHVTLDRTPSEFTQHSATAPSLQWRIQGGCEGSAPIVKHSALFSLAW